MKKLKEVRISRLEKQLKSLDSKKQEKILSKSVTSDHIAEVISKSTGIPIDRMLEGEKEKIIDVLESDEPIPQVNAKLQAAQTLLDRVGVAKKESINVNHNHSGGIFILPDKKETIIDATPVEVEND